MTPSTLAAAALPFLFSTARGPCCTPLVHVDRMRTCRCAFLCVCPSKHTHGLEAQPPVCACARCKYKYRYNMHLHLH